MNETITPTIIRLARTAEGGFEAQARASETSAQQPLSLPATMAEPTDLASAELWRVIAQTKQLLAGRGFLQGQMQQLVQTGFTHLA